MRWAECGMKDSGSGKLYSILVRHRAEQLKI
jgi:hypothetical protein